MQIIPHHNGLRYFLELCCYILVSLRHFWKIDNSASNNSFEIKKTSCENAGFWKKNAFSEMISLHCDWHVSFLV